VCGLSETYKYHPVNDQAHQNCSVTTGSRVMNSDLTLSQGSRPWVIGLITCWSTSDVTTSWWQASFQPCHRADIPARGHDL